LNKIDRLKEEETENLTLRFGALAISALDRSTFRPLLAAIEKNVFDENLVESKV